MKPSHLVRSSLTALVAAVAIPVLGCSAPAADSEPGGIATEVEALPPELAESQGPAERLAAILALGDAPGALPTAVWSAAEADLLELLPPAPSGRSWRAVYTDLPAGDYLAFDLLEGAEGQTTRVAWFHLLYRPEPFPDDRFDGDPVGGFPTAERQGRYLRVGLRELELVAVPESEELRRGSALRELVGTIDLEGLARLGD